MYSDFASEGKVKSQRRKSSMSTSATLGLRFCGSYKYNTQDNRYERTDKYVGRTSDIFILTNLLKDFFSVSESGKIYFDIIRNVIEQLEKIRNVIIELGNSIKHFSRNFLHSRSSMKLKIIN